MTHYWVGVRAVDSCNRAGPHVVAEVTTTPDQLHPARRGPVFHRDGGLGIGAGADGGGDAPRP